ncbi:DNA mismatch repair endonuclease MutL [Phaeocystidibacter marisrubri]|uniref:DNA mismatch repair protein MutL n=1 Tax=Phaeocystidibacter marisrubri TaxID=1577780 RepID=A0A6L3ZH27_9FLAO|nr:DNA mismatch repair endonuclease MutL [Phaeocystidibacter marisrubri]KAB2817221.1 DNA mismatch repair endonuclease MutL [Phaeocystidibacter marisrubri]GGH76366.1 DNA mismatch repair protein MutL [Phaeocystidibacter marisrubri]
MSDIISLLPDHVANQIAAGEVVQRPSSVVKELLENSVDSGATEIHLIIQDAGKTLIQVVDNGKGMSYADARMAFERHATSKIKLADDLFDLHTMGFRGEALASIAAVAQVELKTRPHDEDLGTELRIEGSKVIHQKVCQCGGGTSLAVSNLFFNIPARRQFLKSDNVENRHIIDAFEHVALANPEIAFKFTQNNVEIFHLPEGNYRQRITSVFGKKFNERLVPVEEITDVVALSGFVLKPQYARKTRGEQFFFVNDRFIKNSYLHHAVNHAFEHLIKGDEHPSYFLYLRIDPKRIDVNIHPTKTEIKFDDEKAIYAIIRSAVKHALGQFNIAPTLDFNQNVGDIPIPDPTRAVIPPTIQVDPNFNPFNTETPKTPAQSSGASSSFKSSSFGKTPTDNWQELYKGSESTESGNIQISSGWEDDTIEKNATHFQLDNRYVITKVKSALIAIHQQRAHRRINYERFLQVLNGHHAPSQQLLFPISIHMNGGEMEALKSVNDTLHRMGFELEFPSAQQVLVQGIPMHISDGETQIVLDQLVEDVKSDADVFRNDPSHAMAKSLSSHIGIKNGQVLNREEMQHLIDELFACEMPYTDIFGRPIIVQIGLDELDKKFR